MSQHLLNTVCQGRPVRVMLGWDRRLEYFFLLVEVLDENWVEAVESSIESDPNGYLYCNLDDEPMPTAVDESLAYCQQRLLELEIPVLATMFTNVESDRRNKAGIRRVIYQRMGGGETFDDVLDDGPRMLPVGSFGIEGSAQLAHPLLVQFVDRPAVDCAACRRIEHVPGAVAAGDIVLAAELVDGGPIGDPENGDPRAGLVHDGS